MADIKKFLDQSGVSTLWTRIAEELAAEKSRAEAAEQAAAAAAKAAQDDIDALETYVGTIPEGYTEADIVAYINKKAEETLSAATGDSDSSVATVQAALNEYIAKNDPLVKANADAIDAIEADYLVEADKTELDGKITANTTEIARVNSVLVNALENEGAGLDSIKELATWIETHGEEAAGYAAAITALEGKVDTGDQKVSEYVAAAVAALNIADYAKAADLLALAARVTTAEGKITTLEGNDVDKETRIAAMEAKVTKWDAAESNAKAYADSLAPNYDASGSAAQALTDAKAYTDAEIDKIPAETVLYTAQTLTEIQKEQARANIGAGTSSLKSWNELEDRPISEVTTTVSNAISPAYYYEYGGIVWEQDTTGLESINYSGATFYRVAYKYGLEGASLTDMQVIADSMTPFQGENANNPVVLNEIYYCDGDASSNAFALGTNGLTFVIVANEGATISGQSVNPGVWFAEYNYFFNYPGLPSTATSTVTKLDIKYLPDHNHDDRYYTESEIDQKLQQNASTIQSAAVATAKAYTDTEINTKIIALTPAEIEAAIASASTEA